MLLPKMYRIRQTFPRPRIDDVAAEVSRQLKSLSLERKIRPGQTVALTVGSRGIANIAVMAKAVVDEMKALGAVPFVVPAMGSHGGATAEGQRAVLAGFGVTEEFLGCEIRSSMETVVVAETAQGLPVHIDKHACSADHLIVMNRVKPHTTFVGEIESGLHKMMLIGLSKHTGALLYHRAIRNYPFGTIIKAVSSAVIEKCRVVAGIAIVENSYDETALIEAIPPERFYEREQQLLQQALAWMPQLPFTEIDLLVIDRIGKNISGTGMDTNIVGRKYNDHVATEHDRVNCKRIFVRDLTYETKGNGLGIGIAEFTTRRCVDKLNLETTRINAMTSSHPTACMLPFAYVNDRLAIEDAMLTIGLTEPPDARIIQIADTLHLAEMMVSDAFLREGADFPFEVLSGPSEMTFDAEGNLPEIGHTHD
ncbi:lactate racemase domain-containing protein [Planctomicrobium sp. SH664]|uniref:lactate racemase domain-containing protein n=1 Tax=Planctomicrobium sp. SH664 TaxID=3448125 RepID=UPI003F5AFF69